MTPIKPAVVLLAFVLVAGCDDFDSLYGGRAPEEPEFSDPTDDDEPGETSERPGEVDPTPTDPTPTDPITPLL
jgi:hypothetical protein